MSENRKLTLEDVEVCIRVVAEFMRQYKRASRLLRAMGRQPGVYPVMGRNLFDMIIQQSLSRGQGESEEEEVELSEEEISRLEDIVAKYKEGKKADKATG